MIMNRLAVSLAMFGALLAVCASASAESLPTKRKGYVPQPRGPVSGVETEAKFISTTAAAEEAPTGGPVTEVGTPAGTAMNTYPVISGGGCCAPTVSYQCVTVYNTVSRTICETVPVTKKQEFTEVHCVPVKRTEPREETYYEQKWVDIKVKVKVCRPVTVKQKVTYVVCVPVTKDVEEKYTTTEMIKKKQSYSYNVTVPVMRTEDRSSTSVVYDCVPVTRTKTSMSYSTVPVTTCTPTMTVVQCAPACGSCGSCAPPSTMTVCGTSCQTTYQTVCTPVTSTYTDYEQKARTVTTNYKVQVCDYKTETKTGEYDVMVCQPVVRTRTVKVTTMTTKNEEKEIDVQVMKEFDEEVPSKRCELEKKVRKYNVEITEMKTETKKVMRDVTTYETRTRVVTEKVPCTVMVPVYTCPTPAPAPAVCMPAPTCY